MYKQILSMQTARQIFKRRISNIPCILNGKPVYSGKTVPVYSHEETIIHHISPLENASAQIGQICKDAHAGFLKWNARPAEEKRDILLSAASIIETHKELYVDAHRAIGGAESIARFSVDGAVASCREYASQITNPHGLALHSANSDLAFTRQTAMGPILAIAAWNVPAILWARSVMAPLAAGCSVVLKSSEKAPLPPYLLVQHLLEAGVDPRALQLLQVEPSDNKQVVEQLLGDRHIKKVNFTGSTAVGRQVAAVAAQNLKPALLELGGKNVMVVCKDADLEKAAANAVFSAWFHKGQICMCVDTIYVAQEVYEKFLGLLKLEARNFVENKDLALNQRDTLAAEKIHTLVSDAVSKGARVVFGGSTQAGPSNCSPVILTDVTSSMRLAEEETFGPVIAVEKYASLESVLDSINDQQHGLKAAVWSSDVLAAVDIAGRLDFGGVHINGSTIHDEPTVPHGGVKDSGSGRFNSVWGIEEFRYTKAITVSR